MPMSMRRLFSQAAISRMNFGTNVALAQDALRRADAVCFDFDSTVITEEGIDVLAFHCGAGEAVSDLTKKAMDGSLAFQDALAARLELMRPSRADVSACLERNTPQLTPYVSQLFDTLRSRGTVVHIVSGGFRAMIEPMAVAELGVKKDDIFANTIFWRDDGSYAGFEKDEPTASQNGKPTVINLLKRERGYGTVVMVGDGATDLQAKPPANAFIGYGGVVQRDVVKQRADWFVTDFSLLVDCLLDDTP